MVRRFFSIVKRFTLTCRRYGGVSTFRQVWILLGKMTYRRQDFSFVLLPPAECSEWPLPDGPLRLTWFIPDFEVGSGGHTTIFRMITLLQKLGASSDIVVIPPTKFTSAEKMKQIVVEHFIPDFDGEFFFLGEPLPASNALLATSWETSYYVASVETTGKKLYFVQDFEPMFFSMGSNYLFAENSYRLGLKCITAGPWLARTIADTYGAKTGAFYLAYSRDQYHPLDTPRKAKTVVFYARHLTARRGFELGVLALELVKKSEPDTEIIFFGSNSYPDLTFDVTSMGILEHQELLHLYNSATVGLVISLTNYSLIPNEMMACGLPVVDIQTECMTEMYDNGVDIVLSQPNPVALAEAVLGLLNDPCRQESISRIAYERVSRLSWEVSAERVLELLKTL